MGPCRRTLCTSRGQEDPSSIHPGWNDNRVSTEEHSSIGNFRDAPHKDNFLNKVICRTQHRDPFVNFVRRPSQSWSRRQVPTWESRPSEYFNEAKLNYGEEQSHDTRLSKHGTRWGNRKWLREHVLQKNKIVRRQYANTKRKIKRNNKDLSESSSWSHNDTQEEIEKMIPEKNVEQQTKKKNKGAGHKRTTLREDKGEQKKRCKSHQRREKRHRNDTKKSRTQEAVRDAGLPSFPLTKKTLL